MPEVEETAELEVVEAPEVEESAETAPDSEPDKPEVEGDEEQKPQTLSKSEKKLLKRVNKLTGRMYGLENENEQLKAQLEHGRKAEPESVRAVPSGRPKADDFATTEEWIEAIADWKAQERERERIQQTEQQRVKETFDTYNQRVSEARGKYDDFDEVVGQAIKIPQLAQLAVVELENGPDIAYYLGNHPDVCEELRDLSPIKVIARIVKIGDSLSSGTQPPKKKLVSSAPEPIKPVGGAAAKSSVPLADLPYSEYAKRRNAEEQKNRR